MTIKEAIEWIKTLKGLYKPFTGDANNALDMAISALEKQVPKKGIKENIAEGVNKGLHKYYCPICYKKGDLSNKCNVGEYCSKCGQKLDWSDTD